MRSIRRSVWFLLLYLAIVPLTAQPDPIEARLADMSLERKVGQMFMVNLYGAGLSDAGRDVLQTWQPGAVFLGDSNISTPQDVTRLTNTYQQTITDAGGVPLFIATDQEGGLIERLQDGFTEWPVPMLLTATNDPALVRSMGQAMGAELLAVGVNMNLAPVVDLQTNLANPIIGRRSPGSDPDLVGRSSSTFITGMRDAGVLATAKHFPGHGETDEDSHTTLPNLTLDRQRLDTVELVPFRYAIDAEVGAVMVAHIWFSAFDPDPLPASLSANIITGLLREDLGYEGIIMTDAMDMDAIDTAYPPEEAALLAVQAGVDLLAIGAHAGEGIQTRAMGAIVEAVRAGEIPESRIDASVRRILQAKADYGLLDGWQPLNVETTAERLDLAGNAALIEDIFRAGVTLAHDHNAVLPLEADSNAAIIFPGNRQSIRTVCSRHSSEQIRWLAINDSPTEGDIDTAQMLASQVDSVVVFTQNAYTNGAQQALVNALPPEKTLVVALYSPYDLLRFPAIGGYLLTYSPLDPAITAACEILFGIIPPNGTLAVDLYAVQSD